MGWSQLMPDEVIDWLVEEAGEAFTRGAVFVARSGTRPASIRITRSLGPTRPPISRAERCSGTPSRHKHSCSSRFHRSRTCRRRPFQRFLSESEDDLARFRVHFRRLVDREGSVDIDDVVGEIRGEVASMRQSRRYAAMRRNISHLGGVLATVGAGAAAAITRAPEIALPVAASTGLRRQRRVCSTCGSNEWRASQAARESVQSPVATRARRDRQGPHDAPQCRAGASETHRRGRSPEARRIPLAVPSRARFGVLGVFANGRA